MQKAANSIRASFDERVQEWDTDRYRDETYIGRARVALRWVMSIGRGKRILDIGCGTGRQTVAVLQSGNRAVSMDFSYEMARATRDRVVREMPDASPAVIVGDAMHPPFRPGSFDAVLALGLVGFLPDRPQFVAEMRDLLGQDGELVCDAAIPEERVLFHMISRAIEVPVQGVARAYRALRPRAPKPEIPVGWYKRTYVKHTPEEFEALLQSGGFRKRASGGAGFGDLRIRGVQVVPWRIQSRIARVLSHLSVMQIGAPLARHALTYVVRAQRNQPPVSAVS